MTYPTPDESIHKLPPAVAKRQALATQQSIEASAGQLRDGLVNHILAVMTGGVLGTGKTPSQMASTFFQNTFLNLFKFLGIDDPAGTLSNIEHGIFTGAIAEGIVAKTVSILTFGIISVDDVHGAFDNLHNWWQGFLNDVHHALTWNPSKPITTTSTDKRISDVAEAARYTRRDATRGVTDLVPHWRVPSIPVSHLGAANPNLLVGGGFDDAANFDVSTTYVWDGTVGRTGVGSAKTIGTGNSQILYSNSINVLSGDTFTVGGYVKWSNVYSSGTAMQLSVVAYAGTSAISTNVIGSVSGLAANATATWTNLAGNWNYDGSVSSTVDNIRLKLTVSDTVTAGTVWWDDISAYKTGILTGSLVTGLQDTGTIAGDLQGTLDAAVDGYYNYSSGTTSGTTLSGFRGIHRNHKQATDNAQSKANTANSIASGYYASGSNLLANPSFEDTSFVVLNNGVLASTTNVPAEPARTGINSLKLVATGNSYPYSYVATDTTGQVYFPCSQGETIYLEAWVYGKTTNAQASIGGGIILGVTAFDTAKANGTGYTVTFSAGTQYNGGWTKISGTATIAAAGKAFFTPYIQLNATVNTGETYYFDDFVVREVSYSQNVVDGVHQAVNGGTTVNNAPSSVLANFQKFLNGGATPQVKKTAVPDVTIDMSTDMQSTVDGVHQAINGGTSTGNSVSTVKSSLDRMHRMTTNNSSLVISGDFEDSTIPRTTYGTNTVAYSTAQKYLGTQSYLVTANASSYQGFYLAPHTKTVSQSDFSTSIPVRPGQSYYMEVWVYLPTTNAGTAVPYVNAALWDDAGHTSQNTVVMGTATEGSWQQLSAVFTVPSTYVYTHMYVQCLYATGQTVGDLFYWDNATIRQESFSQSIIDGIHQSVNASSTTNNPLSSIGSNFAKFLTGGSTPQVKKAAVPNITLDMSTDLQGALNGAVDGYNNLPVGTTTSTTVSGFRDIHRAHKQASDGAQSTANRADSIAAGSLASGSNLLANPSFEDTSFVVLNNGVLASTANSEPARTGTKSLKLVGTATSAPYSYVATNTTGQVYFPCSQNEVIYLEAWVFGKSSNIQASVAGGITLGISTYSTAKVFVQNFTVTFAAGTQYNNGWTKLSGKVTITGSGQAFFTPYILLSSSVNNGETYYFDDVVVRENTIASTASDAAGDAITGTGYLQTSIVREYYSTTMVASGTFVIPYNFSEFYVILFGAGGKGGNATSASAPGAGGAAGAVISQQLDKAALNTALGLDVSDEVAGTSITVTIGSTSSPVTSFGTILSTNDAYKSFVSTPLGLLPTANAPSAGGAGALGGAGNTNSGQTGSAGGTTSAGVAGGSGGASVNTYITAVGGTGGSGNPGILIGLTRTGGSGGGGGGGCYTSGNYAGNRGGNGGVGGFPGGGGGGGGGIAAPGSPTQGLGALGGNGMAIIVYKLATTTAP